MALTRYRVVRFATHYGVIDHGEPQGEVQVSQGEGEGTLVPRYLQDGDPESKDTTTTVAFRATDLSSESKQEAVDRASQLNAGAEVIQELVE